MTKRKTTAPTKRPSTAIARRPQPALTRRVAELVAAVNHPSAGAPMTLPSEPLMVPSYVGTLKLTEAQVHALRRPLERQEIRWRSAVKGGPEIIPFLSHNGCRDRLDAAFGLGGWGMVPVGMPKIVESEILVPYGLFVDGVPRAYAWGAQQYSASNGNMTYGDALEGAKSNAISRCGKELGIGRELWDKRYVEELLQERHGERRQTRPAGGTERLHGDDGRRDETISDGQRKRLFVILRKSGRDELSFRSWLAIRYGYESTKDIKRRDYDPICQAVEAPGLLPPPDREPGMED